MFLAAVGCEEVDAPLLRHQLGLHDIVVLLPNSLHLGSWSVVTLTFVCLSGSLKEKKKRKKNTGVFLFFKTGGFLLKMGTSF